MIDKCEKQLIGLNLVLATEIRRIIGFRLLRHWRPMFVANVLHIMDLLPKVSLELLDDNSIMINK